MRPDLATFSTVAPLAVPDSEAEDGRASAEDADDRDMDDMDMDMDLRTGQCLTCIADDDDATYLDIPEAMEPEAMEEAEAEVLIIELVIEPDIIDIESIDPDMAAEGADIIDIIDMEADGIMSDIIPESMADLYNC